MELFADNERQHLSRPRGVSEGIDYLVFDILYDSYFGRSVDIKEPAQIHMKSVPDTIHAYIDFDNLVYSEVEQVAFLGLMLRLRS